MKRPLVIIFGVFWLGFWTSQSSDAQFIGPFLGPFYGPMYAPYQSPTQMIQNRKPITQNVGGPVTSAPDNPNAYWNHLRDPGYNANLTPRTDLRRGVSGIDVATSSNGRSTSPKSEKTKAGNTTQSHFLGFFGPNKQLVWPIDSPLAGDLSGKRATVDASMAVLRAEVLSKKPVTVATVVTSRNDLLDYGRPALATLRENQPTHADSFHAWLLDLYNTVGQLNE